MIPEQWQLGHLIGALAIHLLAIGAEYNNGILEVRLPVETGATITGTEIEIRS